MAEFPIQRTTRTLPGTTGGVRAGLDVDTGAGLVAGAVSQLGGALTGLGIKFDLIEADTQLTKAIRLTTEEINRLGLSYRTNNDPATYQVEYEKSLGAIQSFAPKNRRAAQEFDKFYQREIPTWQKGVEGARLAKAKDNFRAEGFLGQQSAISTGNTEPYLAHLEKGKAIGIYTAEEVERLGLDTVLRADYNTALNAIQLDPTDKNVEEVLKNHPNLTATQRTSLRRESWSIQTNRRLKDERQRAELEEQTRKDMIDLVQTNDLTFKILRENKDKLDASTYTSLTNYVMSLSDLKLEDPYLNRIYLDIQSDRITTESQIDEYVKAEKIDFDDAEKMKAILDKRISGAGSTYAKLHTEALDIWRGTKTKQQFDTDLLSALTDNEINKDEFGELSKLAATTLKTAQAQALSRADTEAGRQLVDYREDDAHARFMADSLRGLKPDIATLFENKANEIRRQQFNDLARFNKSMRDFVASNPDAFAAEIYKHQQGLLATFRETKSFILPRPLVTATKPGFLGRKESEFPEGLPKKGEELPTKIEPKKGATVEFDEYAIRKGVRNKWYKLPVRTRFEITAALAATNPETGESYTWFDVVNDPVIKAELDKIK